jgi:ABC-type branched-subunit amino acid transport system substrate-binding protein
MKRIITILAIFALIFAFGANMALAAEKKPKEYNLHFITGLSGPLAQAAQTQKLAVELLVEQYNAKGGLNMPWGKVPIKLAVADDEMKLDVGVE